MQPAPVVVQGPGRAPLPLWASGRALSPQYRPAFNAVLRKDPNLPIYDNVVPNFGFKAWNNSATDSPAVRAAQRQGILLTNASRDALAMSAADAAAIPDAFGWLSNPDPLVVGEPTLSFRRMSTKLLLDAPARAGSKYGAYVWTRDGTPVPQQTAAEGITGGANVAT